MTFRTSSQLLGGLALLFFLRAEGVGAEVQAPDSLSLHSRARSAQGNFERMRSAYAPVFNGGSGGSCDEVIGRMCLRYLSGLPDDWVPPSEDRRVLQGREVLIDHLTLAGDSLPGDRWILGQRVAYLGEAGEWEAAYEVAQSCQSERWWCNALRGLTLHQLGSIEEAEDAFASSFREMPEPIAAAWEEVVPLLDRRFEPILRELPADSIRLVREWLWVLADPLFLLPGNDVRTTHYARHTLAAIRAEGDNPYGLRWGNDLHEIFTRYGPEVAYQQIGPLRPGVVPIPLVGRFDPAARGFFPGALHFLTPAEIAPGEWRADDRSVRSRYAPTGAPRIGEIEVQQARFRRGEDLLLILGWRVADGIPHWKEEEEAEGSGPANGPTRAGGLADGGLAGGSGGSSDPEDRLQEILSGLFLLPLGEFPEQEPSGVLMERYPVALLLQGDSVPYGVVMAQAPAGRYLLSLELVDRGRERGWRARHGVVSLRLPSSVPALSDLLLLAPSSTTGVDAEESDNRRDSLELHLERVLPTLLIEGDSVEVAWEVYGVDQVAGTARFTLSVAPEERGGLRRALEFLRLSSADPPVELSWEEDLSRRPDTLALGPLFRRLTLDLSNLPEGMSRISIEMRLPGREEVVSELFINRTR